MTGYEPVNTPKPVADGLWLIDGPAIKFYGMPFSTRATVVRLENGVLELERAFRRQLKTRPWTRALKDMNAAKVRAGEKAERGRLKR